MLTHLLAALLATSPIASLVIPETGSAPALSGRITNTADGSPLSEARITVVEAGRTVTTDMEGKYRITGLPTGTFVVSVSSIGFAPRAQRVRLSDQEITLDFALKPSLVELPPIQVTSTPGATDPLTSPQPTAVVDADNLRAAQSPSLGETLNQVAGVHSLSTGVGIGKPVIRGLTSNRVLVLDDGQRLETQQWGDEHGPNLETALADRIEVIRGPASVLYGSDALGGVVNVIPKPLPTAEPGKVSSAARSRRPTAPTIVNLTGHCFSRALRSVRIPGNPERAHQRGPSYSGLHPLEQRQSGRGRKSGRRRPGKLG